jgi:hypothetical protein
MRVLHVEGKCSDLCSYTFGDIRGDGYVPHVVPIGGGDYLGVRLCLDCGQTQGEFPISDEDLPDALRAPDRKETR